MLVLLGALLVATLPAYSYSREWGYYPSRHRGCDPADPGLCSAAPDPLNALAGVAKRPLAAELRFWESWSQASCQPGGSQAHGRSALYCGVPRVAISTKRIPLLKNRYTRRSICSRASPVGKRPYDWHAACESVRGRGWGRGGSFSPPMTRIRRSQSPAPPVMATI